MKKLLPTLVVLALVVSIGLFSTGCKKDDTGTGPPPPPGGGYGSGTISSTSPTQGNLSFSGQGVWPAGAGPSVIAVYDTVANGLEILGYQQVSGSNYSFILVSFLTPGGISARTYTIGGDSAFVLIGANVDTNRVDTLGFFALSGTITVSSVSGTNVVGSFSVSAIRLSDLTTATFAGNFNVTYVRGRSVVDEEGGGRGGSGSLSFNSDRGNFSASGTFNPNATSGTMVGAWRHTDQGVDYITIYAASIVSQTNMTIVALVFEKQGTLGTGSYAIGTDAEFFYMPNFNPTDTVNIQNVYVLTGGNVAISTLSASSAQGTFSGNGTNLQQTQPITVTNGTYNVNYVTGVPPDFDKRLLPADPISRRIREAIQAAMRAPMK